MKKILLALFLLSAPLAYAGDDLATRSDIYGPQVSQWSYANVTGTATIKSSPGVLNCVTLSSAPSNGWVVYDSSDTNTVSTVLARFPASAQVGSYCFGGATTTEGIAVVLPASGSVGINVTYR